MFLMPSHFEHDERMPRTAADSFSGFSPFLFHTAPGRVKMHATLLSVLQLSLSTLSLAASIPNAVLPRQGSGTLKYGMRCISLGLNTQGS